MSSKESKEPSENMENQNHSPDVSDSSLVKEGCVSPLTIKITDNEDDQVQDVSKENDSDDSYLNMTSSKANDSSIKLVLETTPEITKVPDSQFSEGESMGVTSQASTVEIESSGTGTERGTLSPATGNEESLHKLSSSLFVGKGTSSAKNVSEDEHSLHISNDEIFDINSGVVASTPQSVNPRVHTQGGVAIDEEMIPSSPDEKKMTPSVLMPALYVGQKHSKRERRTLNLMKSPKKGERPEVMHVGGAGGKHEGRDNESQETLYKCSEEIPESIGLDDEDTERPKSGLKRKLEESVEKEKEAQSRSNSTGEDLEVELIEIKKPRKSIEVVYSKTLSLPSQRYSSPSKRSNSSRSSSSSSSQSSAYSQKSIFSSRLTPLMEPLKMSCTPEFRRASNSEDLNNEDFTLRMSPSQGSELELGKDEGSAVPMETEDKETKYSDAMSTIVEVDEGPDDVVSSKGETVAVSDKETENDKSVKVGTDCDVTGERSSCEAVRPSSPEYLSDDQSKSWMTLTGKTNRAMEANDQKMDANEEGAVTSGGRGEQEDSTDDVTVKEVISEKSDVTNGCQENAEGAVDLTSELIRNGDPGPAQFHQWLFLRICSDVDAATGQLSKTKLLEMYDYNHEVAKGFSKGKHPGRVSDVSSACQGDISSPPNTISPLSTSGEGKPFSLPPTRASIISTFSHSSSSTSGSDLHLYTKALQKAKFTKPSLPSSTVEDTFPGFREIIKDLKGCKMVRIDNSALGNSEGTLDLPQSTKLECEQFCHKYVLYSYSSQVSTFKSELEETSKVNVSERRYLTRRSKVKRAPLRMKRKVASTKTSTTPNSSQSVQNNGGGENKLQVEESSILSSSRTSPPEVLSATTSTTERKIKAKETRMKSNRSSQANTSSQPSSENCSEPKRSKSSQFGSPIHVPVKTEIPLTPSSSTVNVGHMEGIIYEGALVFARFSDKWYYPGKVRKREKDDRWIIDFDDGDVRSILEDFVVVAEELSQGQSVYADVENGSAEYESGIITKIETKKKQVHYTVALDNNEIRILPRSKLCLTEDQVNIIKEMVVDPVLSTPKRKADVSLDNVLEGKRTRRQKTGDIRGSSTAGLSTPRPSTPSPSTSGPSKSTSRKKMEPALSNESSSVHGTASDFSNSGYEGISGLEPVVSPEPVLIPGNKGKGPGRKKGSGRQLKMVDTQRSTGESSSISKVITDKLGPVPPKDSTIFKGKYFILSYGSVPISTTPSKESHKTQTDTSTDEDGTDTYEGGDFSTSPFDKKHLRKQLEAGGGKVFDHFKDECMRKSCLVISNRPNLTPDYILALSAEMNVVSHQWVIDCCSQSKLLPWEDSLLPVGWSIEKRRYIESHERSKHALKNVEVVLASDSGHRFLEFWRRVLVVSGAHVRKVSSKTMSSREDISYAKVVVTDHKCPEGILDRANETGVPVVSTVWVKQTLIHGEIRPFSGHSMYKYDHRHD